MTRWYPITAKFTSEEKRILDILRDTYGLNYNKSLRAGIEILSRLITMAEYQATADSKTIQKINKIGKKYARQLDADVKKTLQKTPIKQQEAEYGKYSSGVTKIFSQFDNIFLKNRKIGRKKIPRKRGRPIV
jgi:hypothetical protein